MSARRWRVIGSVVLCHFHGEVHKRSRNPYDMFDDRGQLVDECGPEHWHNLAALATKEEVDGY